MIEQTNQSDRKSKERATYTVILDVKHAEWGKKQDGGLSLLVRRLLREEYEKKNKPEQP